MSLQRLDGSKVSSAGSMSSPYAWSSIKPVIVATLLRERGGPARLSSQQKAHVRAAMSASDNNAAMALFQSLAARHGGTAGAAGAMTQTLRKAGDRTTQVSSVGRDGFSPYGQTRWPTSKQVLFMSSLARGCLLNRASTAYLLGVMSEVTSSQRWGFGALPTVQTFKGGWGPDPGGAYVVRQMGLVKTRSGQPVAFAAAVRAPGGFQPGIRALSAAASWTRGLKVRGVHEEAC